MIKLVQKNTGIWCVYENDVPLFLSSLEKMNIDFAANDELYIGNGKRGTNLTPYTDFVDADDNPFASVEEIINYISNSSIMSNTGHAFYKDTQYNSANPFSIPANVETVMPNNAGQINEEQLPSDVISFYTAENQTIDPKNIGDNLLMGIAFKVKTDSNNSWLQIAVDIGTPQAPWLIFSSTYTFPRGVGVEHPYTHNIIGFSGSTFQPNRGQVKMLCNNGVDIYDISYVIQRTHKAK